MNAITVNGLTKKFKDVKAVSVAEKNPDRSTRMTMARIMTHK